MPIRIRLSRHGAIFAPFYRICVGDSRRIPTGRYLEQLGTYDPRIDKNGTKQIRLNLPRVKYWLGVGAQPSAPVAKLLAKFNFIPTPPLRRDIIVPEIVTRALAGESIAEQLESLTPKPNTTEGIYDGTLSMAAASKSATSTGLCGKGHASVSAGTLKSMQQIARWKLKSPAPAIQQQLVPSQPTISAWGQMRSKHEQKVSKQAQN